MHTELRFIAKILDQQYEIQYFVLTGLVGCIFIHMVVSVKISEENGMHCCLSAILNEVCQEFYCNLFERIFDFMCCGVCN